MTRRVFLPALVWLVTAADTSHAIEWDAIEPVVIGGRFQYATSVERASVAFPRNTTTQSSLDLTRLMLDLKADTRYGGLYLKGSALWDHTFQSQIQKRFLFEQGDYLWHQQLTDVDYTLRLFANERRFTTYDMIAPLLRDDFAGEGQDNLGVRLDTRVGEDIGVTALYSALGGSSNEYRQIGYVKSDYRGPINASVSYLLDHPGGVVENNHAIVKFETSASYKQAYAIVSYQQSGVSRSGVFFPGADGQSALGSLPKGGALFADVRLTSVRIAEAGELRLIYDFTAIGDEFFNDLGSRRPAQRTSRIGAVWRSQPVALNGRMLYEHSRRLAFEDKKVERLAAHLWGKFANGMDFWVRGDVVETRIHGFDDRGSFVHAALEKQIREVRSGIHAMWKDSDTIFSTTRFAWDGKLMMSPNWSLYWRFILSEQFDVGQTLYGRISFRPNDRIWAIFSYGREVIGDGPYLLEDQDVELSRFTTAQYSILLRGDF